MLDKILDIINSSKIKLNTIEHDETTNVCTKPIKIGVLNSSIILPINIICNAQKIALTTTRESPNLIVAS